MTVVIMMSHRYLIFSFSDIPADAQPETLLLQLGELGTIACLLGHVHIYLGLNLDPGPGAMGNHHQRGDGELPHEPVDKDWSVLGPCR